MIEKLIFLYIFILFKKILFLGPTLKCVYNTLKKLKVNNRSS